MKIKKYIKKREKKMWMCDGRGKGKEEYRKMDEKVCI